MSDKYLEREYPEYGYQNVGLTNYLQPTYMSKHTFTALKPSIKLNTQNPRFAINDLKNFATFGNPKNKEQAYLDSLANYNAEMAGKNTMPDRDTNELQSLTPYLSNRIRRMIKYVSVGDEREIMVKNIFPNNRFTKMSDKDVLDRLNKIHRNDIDKIQNIEIAYDQSGRDLAF